MEKALLVVDDDPTSLSALSQLLQQDNYKIYAASDGYEALELLNKHAIQVVLSDYRMPAMDGVNLLSRVNKRYPHVVNILLCGRADSITEHHSVGYYKLLAKPWHEPTLRKHVHEAFQYSLLLQNANHLKNILASNQIGVVVTDEHGVIKLINPIITAITGISSNDITRKNISILDLQRQTPELITKITQELKVKGRWNGNIWLKHKDASSYPAWVSIATLEGTEQRGYVFFVIDTTKERYLEQQLEHQVYFDGLTGLPDKLYFIAQLEQMITEYEDTRQLFAILLIDLNQFNNVNMMLSHDVGDYLLQSVGERLLKNLRNDDLVARLGGNKFGILLKRVRHEIDVEKAVLNTHKLLNQPFILEEGEIHITSSISASIYPQDGFNTMGLLENAEKVLNYIKEKDRNSHRLYNPAANRGKRHNFIKSDIYKALEFEQFTLDYQPIISAETGNIISMEALLRWQHPDFGTLKPDDFIEICNDTGLMIPVGNWVIDAACKQLSEWRAMGCEKLGVDINLSASQLFQPDLIKSIYTALQKNDLPAKCLSLEVPETVLIKNINRGSTVFKALQDLGVQLMIDDFGTDCMSLTQIKSFAFHGVKINKSSVGDAIYQRYERSLLANLIAISKSLGIKIVAKGVENNEQLYFLKQHHCELAQGYLLGGPFNKDDATELLSRRHRFQ